MLRTHEHTNDYLTFTLTKRNIIFSMERLSWCSCNNFDSNPTDEILLVAGCLALYISSIDIVRLFILAKSKKAGAPD